MHAHMLPASLPDCLPPHVDFVNRALGAVAWKLLGVVGRDVLLQEGGEGGLYAMAMQQVCACAAGQHHRMSWPCRIP
jgi:hypothetical protein